MLEMKIKAKGRRYVAPEDLRQALGAERAREKLADAIEALLLQMDAIDGDPDEEGDDNEDSFQLSDRARSIAADCPSHDVEQDSGSWTEWQTRGRSKDRLGHVCSDGHPLREDDEEDDAPEEDDGDSGVEDGPHDPDTDRENAAEYDAPFPNYAVDQTEPKPWIPADDLRARKGHTDRIRATKCAPYSSRWRGLPDGYQFIKRPHLIVIPTNNN